MANLKNVVQSYDRIQEEELTKALATQKKLPYVNLVNYPFTGDVLSLIPQKTAEKYSIIAFMKLGQTVKVASSDPFQPGLAEVMNEIGTKNDLQFQPYVCSSSSVKYALGLYKVMVTEKPSSPVPRETKESFAEHISSLQDLKSAIEQVSTTELLETILSGGLVLEASDIHFEPQADGVLVRFRIDGTLMPIITLPEKSYKALSARIKTSARIKLDRNTVPQDGRFTFKNEDQETDIRVNTAPTSYGETIALRLLSYKRFFTFDQLQLNPETHQAIQEAIHKPNGLILFTGPTGSGKTTTLYAILQLLNRPDKKVITIEDPVEYRIAGIEQIQVRPPTSADLAATRTVQKPGGGVEQVQIAPHAGFDFADALKGVLRQDPDIIMVGEIRDKETAEIACNASLTGHLVLSTLHTTSAAGAFVRLLQMGVPKYLLADSIGLIVAQRLVRRICSACNGKKCDVCNQTGFKGRILIAEHYVPDQKTVELIRKEATLREFEELFKQQGYHSLLEDGLEKARLNLTTEQEVRSVVSGS